MKILPVNYVQNHTSYENKNVNFVFHESLQKDTFTKSPSFGNAPDAKLAQEILSNPKLRGIVENFVGNTVLKVILGLFGIAAGGKAIEELADSIKEKEGNNNFSADSLLGMLMQNPEDISKLKEENNGLKQENEELKGENERLKGSQSASDETAKATAETISKLKEENDELKQENEKLKGENERLKAQENEEVTGLPEIPSGLCNGLDSLKAAISGIKLDDEYTAKLRYLCDFLVKNEAPETNTGLKVNRNMTALKFAKDLEETSTSKETTIDSYYKIFGPEQNNESEVYDDQDDLVPVTFPKRDKRGALNAEQKELKAIIADIRLTEEEGKKLTEICAVAINDSYKKPNGEIVYGKDFIKVLIQELKTTDDISSVIEKNYKELGLDIPKAEDSSQNPSTERNESWKRCEYQSFGTAEDDLFYVDIYYDRKLNKFKVSATESGEIIKLASKFKRNILSHKEDIYAYADECIQEAIDRNDNDDELDKTNPKIIRWLKKDAVPPKINPQDVIKELDNSYYKNIGKIYGHEIKLYPNPQNCPIVNQIVNTINNDPRFQNFTIHAAMRTLERLVDFKSKTPLEDQAEGIMDELTELLRSALKQGVIVDTYVPPLSKHRRKEDGNYETIIKCAPQITLSHKLFNEQQKNIFGTYDIEVTLGETYNGRTIITNIIMQKPSMN